jgi:hypothetical protein
MPPSVILVTIGALSKYYSYLHLLQRVSAELPEAIVSLEDSPAI